MDRDVAFGRFRWKENRCEAVGSDSNWRSRTETSLLRSRRQVAVNAGGEASLKVLAQVDPVLTIECNEASITARKCDLVVAVVPPVGNRAVLDSVSESHHVVRLVPSVLAHPLTIVALAVGPESRRHEVVVSIVRWPLGACVEVERRHDAWDSVRPGWKGKMTWISFNKDFNY